MSEFKQECVANKKAFTGIWDKILQGLKVHFLSSAVMT
jgi:hypothetical protein